MNVFNSDGKLNEAVLAPAVDKKKLFKEADDMWLVKLIFFGIGGALILIFILIGVFYDPVAFLALPVILVVGTFLYFICAHWVQRDAKKV